MDGVKLGFTWFLGVYGSRLDLKWVWNAIPTFSMPWGIGVRNPSHKEIYPFCIHFRDFAF